MIIEWTRGHILLKLGEKLVTVYGEGLLTIPGEVSYVVYTDSIKNYKLGTVINFVHFGNKYVFI